MEILNFTIKTPDLIIYSFTLGAYILKQIDLNRIKKGKQPLFNWLDLIKINKKD